MCEKKINVPALFGEMVFGEQQMQQRLPADVYRAWQQSLAQGTALDRSVAGEIARAMKDWAIEKGRHPLYPLVSAHDWRYCGKARLFHLPPPATESVRMEFSGAKS